MTFSFGQSQHERIEIDVQRYERSPVGNYDDDNWLTVRISVRAGGFRGEVEAAILTGELAAFLEPLRTLYDTLQSEVEFVTMEDQIRLRLIGNGKGHIKLLGEVTDQSGIGNQLHFTLRFDQSELAESIRELEKVTSQFPVRAT
ncbi:MAG: hypothetical protein ABI318_21485 [Chthoniobacteraceae bacterium]